MRGKIGLAKWIVNMVVAICLIAALFNGVSIKLLLICLAIWLLANKMT